MRKDKKQAIKLRKSGLSYLQISNSLKIPKSTLSTWLKDIKLSDEAQNKIRLRVNSTSIKALIDRNIKQTVLADIRHKEIMKESELSFKKYIKDLLFISGVALYWGEGYKKGAYGSIWKSVDFTNSDYKMIKLFVKFARKYLKANQDNLWVQLIISPDQDINKAINFWSNLIKLNKERFIKTYSKVSRSSKYKRNRNTLLYGTVHIRINNVEKFFTMIGWINCLEKYNGV